MVLMQCKGVQYIHSQEKKISERVTFMKTNK